MGIEGARQEGIPEASDTQESKDLEQLRKERAVVFVPGLSEASPIFDNVAISLEQTAKKDGVEPNKTNASMQSARLYVVSTHDDVSSQYQQKISERITKDTFKQEGGITREAPVMGIISDSEHYHDSFENRIELTLKAIREAMTNETKELTLVGHSAGGAAVLAAVARTVMEARDTGAILPKIHTILLAPAVPGDVDAKITTAAPFLRVMIADFFDRLIAGTPSNSYIAQLFGRRDINPTKRDLANILGPLKSKKFMDRFNDLFTGSKSPNFKEKVLESRVPISGGEGKDLVSYPKVLGDLKPTDWPQNLTIDVFVPENDRWVSSSGQTQLIQNVLKHQLGHAAEGFSVPGGHLAPLENEDITRFVAERIFTKRT